jgi:hypothetical protein
VAPVAPSGTQLEHGAPVTSVGCNHGDNPTARETRITAINRYQGFPNVEAGGAPVEGRSGGGLFNEQGNLIGICFAADPRQDEGLYASLSSIHAKLDELQLSMVYQNPSTGQASALAGVANGQPSANELAEQFAVRGQDPAATSATQIPPGWPNSPASDVAQATSSATVPAETAPPVAPPGAAGLTSQEQAALEEIGRRAANSEVICIIRPLDSGGRSDVIKLNNVTPAFVRALTGQSASNASSMQPLAGSPATAAGTIVR